MGESRQSQLLRGVLDVCLLAVIERGPVYGYEMTRTLAEQGLPIVAEGSIYPALGRLQRDGLVAAEQVAGNGGPPRKYYGLTVEGEAALARWRGEWEETRTAIDRVLASDGRRET